MDKRGDCGGRRQGGEGGRRGGAREEKEGHRRANTNIKKGYEYGAWPFVAFRHSSTFGDRPEERKSNILTSRVN